MYLSLALYGTEFGVEDGEWVVATATSEGVVVKDVDYLQYLLNTLACGHKTSREGWYN